MPMSEKEVLAEQKANDAAVEKAAMVVPDGFEKANGDCPYCVSNKKKSVMVLIVGSAACLRCGKHWQGWQIGKKYSAALERKDAYAVKVEEDLAAAGAK